jgi:hypothetical protein
VKEKKRRGDLPRDQEPLSHPHVFRLWISISVYHICYRSLEAAASCGFGGLIEQRLAPILDSRALDENLSTECQCLAKEREESVICILSFPNLVLNRSCRICYHNYILHNWCTRHAQTCHLFASLGCLTTLEQASFTTVSEGFRVFGVP